MEEVWIYETDKGAFIADSANMSLTRHGSRILYYAHQQNGWFHTKNQLEPGMLVREKSTETMRTLIHEDPAQSPEIQKVYTMPSDEYNKIFRDYIRKPGCLFFLKKPKFEKVVLREARKHERKNHA